MTEFANLSLRVDSNPVREATSAMERMVETSGRAQGKVIEFRTAADALIAALNRNTAATEQLTGKVSALDAASAKAGASVRDVGAAASTASDNVVKFTNSADAARRGVDTLSMSTRQAAEGWRFLGQQAVDALKRIEDARKRLGTVPAAPPPSSAAPPPPPPPSGGGYNPVQPWGAPAPSGPTGPRIPLSPGNGQGGGRAGGGNLAGNGMNLFYQGSDVFVQSAMGVNPFMIAAQQGPQIAQSFIGPGATSPRELFNAVTSGLSGLASRIGPFGFAMGGAATATIAATAALISYQSRQAETERRLSGVGRASGLTTTQLNAVADASAGPGRLSVGAARDYASTFAGTGRIGGTMAGALVTTVQDYADVTGKDAAEATQELAAAFADPTRGADLLNKQLGFLNDTTRETVQRLQAQGDRLGAQQALFAAYRESITPAVRELEGWTKIIAVAGNAWDALGRKVSSAVTDGTLDQRMEAAEKRLEQAKRAGYSQADIDAVAAQSSESGYVPASAIGVDRAQAEVDNLRRQVVDRDAKIALAQQAQRSLAYDDAMRAVNPQAEALKQIEDKIKLIRRPFTENWIDPTGEAKRAIEALEATAARMRQDLAKGGSEFANSLRDAQFQLGRVGMSPESNRVAEINKAAEDKIRNLSGDVLARADAEVTIRQQQQVDLERARRESTISSTQGSGQYRMGYGQAPAQYRDLYYDAGNKYGVSPDLLASQGYRESSFESRAVSPKGAQGISQFMPATRRGMGDFDPFDPAQAIPKQAELMAQLLKQFNGDVTAALVGYNAGPQVAKRYVAANHDESVLPKETREYIHAIMTPGPGAKQLVDQSVARNQALGDEQAKLAISKKYLDENGLAMDAATREQQLLSQAIAQGREITPAFTAEIKANAMAMAMASRGLADTRAGKELDFQVSQLGRDRYDQQAYASARGIYGDTNRADAQAYIERSREVQLMTEARSTLTDAMSGFTSDLRRGASASEAFGNVMTRLSDKLMSSAIDSIVGNIFKTAGGAGGSGGGGILSSVLGMVGLGGGGGGGGFAGLPDTGGTWLANGGVMTSRGLMPLNRYGKGGVAKSPQVAIYGEGRTPEAYVPLPDGRRIPVAMQGAGNDNRRGASPSVSTGDTYISMTPANGVTPQELAAVVERNNSENRRLVGQILEDWQFSNALRA